jgi:hypothetical protein
VVTALSVVPAGAGVATATTPMHDKINPGKPHNTKVAIVAIMPPVLLFIVISFALLVCYALRGVTH